MAAALPLIIRALTTASNAASSIVGSVWAAGFAGVRDPGSKLSWSTVGDMRVVLSRAVEPG